MEHQGRVEDNKRYIKLWFNMVPETMVYRHKVTGQTVTWERMDTLIHSHELPKLLDTLGINHRDVLKQAGYIG